MTFLFRKKKLMLTYNTPQNTQFCYSFVSVTSKLVGYLHHCKPNYIIFNWLLPFSSSPLPPPVQPHTHTHTHTHTETLQEHLFVTVEVKYNANVDEQCIAINYYKRKKFSHGGHKTSRKPYCGLINLSLWFLKQSKFQQLTGISQKANEKQMKN